MLHVAGDASSYCAGVMSVSGVDVCMLYVHVCDWLGFAITEKVLLLQYDESILFSLI